MIANVAAIAVFPAAANQNSAAHRTAHAAALTELLMLDPRHPGVKPTPPSMKFGVLAPVFPRAQPHRVPPKMGCTHFAVLGSLFLRACVRGFRAALHPEAPQAWEKFLMQERRQ